MEQKLEFTGIFFSTYPTIPPNVRCRAAVRCVFQCNTYISDLTSPIVHPIPFRLNIYFLNGYSTVMALWLKDPPKIKSFYFQPETRVMQMPLFATIFAIVFILTKAAPMPHGEYVCSAGVLCPF